MNRQRDITLLESLRTLWEHRWLWALISGMLALASGVGVGYLDQRNEKRLAPIVDLLMYDFNERGVLDKYKAHKAKLDSDHKLFEQRDASASPYPLIRSN